VGGKAERVGQQVWTNGDVCGRHGTGRISRRRTTVGQRTQRRKGRKELLITPEAMLLICLLFPTISDFLTLQNSPSITVHSASLLSLPSGASALLISTSPSLISERDVPSCVLHKSYVHGAYCECQCATCSSPHQSFYHIRRRIIAPIPGFPA
jgi:hypothetical protein